MEDPKEVNEKVNNLKPHTSPLSDANINLITNLRIEIQKFANKNAILTQTNIGLVEQVNNLNKTIAILMEEYKKLLDEKEKMEEHKKLLDEKEKTKKEKNIKLKIRKLFNSIDNGITGLYRKFIIWLNT